MKHFMLKNSSISGWIWWEGGHPLEMLCYDGKTQIVSRNFLYFGLDRPPSANDKVPTTATSQSIIKSWQITWEKAEICKSFHQINPLDW